jgi:hypothetical protein
MGCQIGEIYRCLDVRHNLAESSNEEDIGRLDYPAESSQEPVYVLQSVNSSAYQRIHDLVALPEMSDLLRTVQLSSRRRT